MFYMNSEPSTQEFVKFELGISMGLYLGKIDASVIKSAPGFVEPRKRNSIMTLELIGFAVPKISTEISYILFISRF